MFFCQLLFHNFSNQRIKKQNHIIPREIRIIWNVAKTTKREYHSNPLSLPAMSANRKFLSPVLATKTNLLGTRLSETRHARKKILQCIPLAHIMSSEWREISRVQENIPESRWCRPTEKETEEFSLCCNVEPVDSLFGFVVLGFRGNGVYEYRGRT